MSTSLIDIENVSSNFFFKKITNKTNKKRKININHIILNRNGLNKKIIDEQKHGNSFQKHIFKKERFSPFKPHFNKLLSVSLLNKATDISHKQKKFYVKSPISLLKDIAPSSTHNFGNNKNIPILPINIDKNYNSKQLCNLHNVEYNSINCIINNFNLSCKNIDSNEESNKRTDNIAKLKKYNDFFNIRNKNFKEHITNLKKNNNKTNNDINIKNLSQLSDFNNMNNNNISNDNIKAEVIFSENKKKEEKIKKINKENKEKMICLKELEKKNTKLKNQYEEIKIKHIEFSKSLERLFKFLKILKNNGLNISEMMENISSGEDYDEYVDDDNEESEESEDNKEEKNETILSDGTVLSNLNQLSSGLLRNHEEYSKGSKLTLKFKNIPILDFCKIKKN